MDERLKHVEGFVEATDFEVSCLWNEYHNEVMWCEDTSGCCEIVGVLDERPVNLTFRFAEVNGHTICFWEAISQVVDYKQIDEWFKDNFHRVPRTNAMNFHTVVGERYVSETDETSD